jgi:hypothetical protein
LFVQLGAREDAIGLVDGCLADLLECLRELVEPHFALTTLSEMVMVGGQHIGLQQLVVA